MESKAHLVLKERARVILTKKGFSEQDIQEEYKLIYKNRLYIIDIVGIKKNKKIYFECGNTTDHKKKILKDLCDEFIHLPYVTKIKAKKRTKKGVTKRKVTLTIDEKIFDLFQKFCEDNGMKVSTRVEFLMKKHLDKYGKI